MIGHCLRPTGPSQPLLMFVSKDRSRSQSGAHERYFTRVCSKLTHQHQTCTERPDRNKHFSLLGLFRSLKQNKVFQYSLMIIEYSHQQAFLSNYTRFCGLITHPQLDFTPWVSQYRSYLCSVTQGGQGRQGWVVWCNCNTNCQTFWRKTFCQKLRQPGLNCQPYQINDTEDSFK